ncbi:MAG TPA: hypothetical protein VGC14_16705 [Rhizobium sp.]
MSEHAIQNISLQIPVKLARMLDARIDAERGSAVLGPVNRSSVMRAIMIDLNAERAARKG